MISSSLVSTLFASLSAVRLLPDSLLPRGLSDVDETGSQHFEPGNRCVNQGWL
ncbi:hypothetical protein [Cernens ardua]|uniref:hypothetical protein n=1 Tax=Cernens ardua TaxID=3402176 RepID=UPI003F980821